MICDLVCLVWQIKHHRHVGVSKFNGDFRSRDTLQYVTKVGNL